MYSLKYRYIVQSYRGRTQSLVAKKRDISENRASRNFDLMITQRRLNTTVQASVINVKRRLNTTVQASVINVKRRLNTTVQASVINFKRRPVPQCQMTFEHSSSSLGRQCQMVSAENNTSGPAPFLNVHLSSCLVLHQMTSDHNRSELGIQDHSNEQSRSKVSNDVLVSIEGVKE
ncbi:hypothetical protein Tco_0118306 [Tanacetum coccineum]